MPAKPYTLILLSPGFAANGADDTCLPERQVFVRSLKELYPTLNIIVLAFQYPYEKKIYCWQGVPVISFGGGNKGKASRLRVWYAAWKTLQQLNKQYTIIGLLSFWLGECAFIGNTFANKHHLKHYCWLLGQDAKKGNSYFKLVRPKAENVIALSDFLADEFYRNYHIKPAHIITSGINPNLFNQQTFDRTIDVLGVGSLIALKQYHLFIQVIKWLTVYLPDIKAVICGKGPEKESLLKLINDGGVQQNIMLVGEVSHPEVLQLMQQSKVLLHPSLYEGFSTVTLEALYAGAHVVSFTRPMNKVVHHHHIVSTQQEMEEMVLAILKTENQNYDSVFPYPIEAIVKQVMNLFTY